MIRYVLILLAVLFALSDADAQLQPRQVSRPKWALFGPPVKYKTVNSVAYDTASPVTVLMATIPKGTWGLNESITVDIWAITKHDSANATISLAFGADTLTLANSFQGALDSTVSRYSFEMRRIGSSIYIFNGNAANSYNNRHIFDALNNDADVQGAYNGDPNDGGGGIFTDVNFNTQHQIKLIVEFQTPSVNDVFSVVSANVIKY